MHYDARCGQQQRKEKNADMDQSAKTLEFKSKINCESNSERSKYEYLQCDR